MQTKKSKIFKNALLIVLGVIIAFFISEFFRRKVGGFAGSYPFAKSWDFAYSLDSLQLSLEDLRNESPKLFCSIDTLSFEKDHTGHWYKIQFCYENKAVNALVTDRGQQSALILVSIINNDDFKIKLINRDFGFLANRREIKAFEKHVLQALKKN